MEDYKEFEFGWLVLATLLPAELLIIVLNFSHIADRPMGMDVFSIVSLVLIVTYFLFYRLNTKVTSDQILVSFGIGLIRKKVKLTEIQEVEIVKNPWYYGWGLRFIPNGTLYNINGFHAVELKLNNRSRTIRIGSKDALKLKHEILERLH